MSNGNRRKKKPVPALKLSISASTGHSHIPYLARNLRSAYKLLSPPLGELSLALVGDQRMSKLHQQFMKIHGPTDVLTFPLDVDAKGRPISGEIVVCVPEARRRVDTLGTGLRRELLLYALHGLLHLCGYDDRAETEFNLMHQTEDAILSRLGVGPVFLPRQDQLTGSRHTGRSRRSAD